jgi:signal transduction histidine kinase
MGIGAYQVREYVRMLGGQVEVQSSPGNGAAFSIRLPRFQQASYSDADNVGEQVMS